LILSKSDNNWAHQFSIGLHSGVRAIAVAPNGDVYVGGEFTTAGGVSANRIAKWDGSTWSALGSGVDNTVYAIAISGSDVYVGGRFITAGGVTVNHIAKWDGSTWSALNIGVNDYVKVITISGDDLYAGGDFTSASPVWASRIAKWDGSTWSFLGSGLNNFVYAIAVSGSNVYAGGWFKMAGGIWVHGIAKWDGSNWSALGGGIPDQYVYAIAVSGNDVYVGGNFSGVDGLSALNIAKWDGNNWSVLGNGLSATGADQVYSVVLSGSDLYAAGRFTNSGAVSANYIAKWDGSSWSALGSGLDNTVFAIASNGNDIHVGGGFTTAGSNPSSNFGIYHIPSISLTNPLDVENLFGNSQYTINWNSQNLYGNVDILLSTDGGNNFNNTVVSNFNNTGNYLWTVDNIDGTDCRIRIQSTDETNVGDESISNFTIISEPAVQPTDLSFSNITASSFNVSYTAASGFPDGYIVIRKSNVSPTFIPVDSSIYSVGQTVGDGTVAYVGTSTSFDDTSLNPATTYFYDIFSYNDSGNLINYLTVSPLENNQTTRFAEPTNQPSNLVFSEPDTNKLTLTFTPASGSPSGYLTIRSTGNTPTFIPQDGISYSNEQAVGDGYIVNSTSISTLIDSGLIKNTVYYYAIYSYNGTGTNINYLTGLTSLSGSRTTLVLEPTAQPTDLLFTNLTINSLTITFTAASPSPDEYFTLRAENSPPLNLPEDGINYSTGDSIGNSIVIYKGTYPSFNQTGLTSGTEYFYTILSSNGTGTAINYMTDSPLAGSQLLADDTNAPAISSVTVNPDPANINAAITVSALVVDSSPLKDVILYYKKGIESSFQNSVTMTNQGNTFSGEIPGSGVTQSGVFYKIFALDAVNNDTTYNNTIQITIPTGTVSTGSISGNPYISGFPENEWRMLSIPLELDNKNVDDVLSDFGTPGNSTWKLFEGSNSDVSTSAVFNLGKAYWLQQRLGSGSKQITLNSGKTTDIDDGIITLLQGWNQIANPFTFAVDWIDDTNAGENQYIKGPIKWDGTKYVGLGQMDGDTTQFTELLPWDGCFVYNAANSNQVLTIDPLRSTTLKKPVLNYNAPALLSTGWKINFRAQSGSFADIYNYIGTTNESIDFEDKYDLPELPVIGDYVSLYFEHKLEDGRILPYTIDYKSYSDEGSAWPMQIKSNIKNKKNTLTWIPENLPENYKIALLDITHNKIVDMNKESYELNNDYEEYPVKFMVFVGTADFVNEELEKEKNKLPNKFLLSQNYPNPFNPSTTISYQLTRQSEVILEIYNILGEKVKTLINKQVYDTGRHEVIWDGTNNAGVLVSSAVYIYRIKVSDFVKSKKMILIR